MSMLSRISERVHYFFEEKRLLNPSVKIKEFKVTGDGVVVLYSFGRPSLVNKKELKNFEIEFYDALSSYDKQWLIKVTALSDVYDNFFNGNDVYNKKDFLNYLKKECGYEKVF